MLVACVLGVRCRSAQDAEKNVFVTALDKDGTPIVGLTVQHFAVRESGRDRRVLRVEPLRIPMHAAVLVDTSAANGATDENFRSAVLAFVARLAATNNVGVYSSATARLAWRPSHRTPPRCDPQRAPCSAGHTSVPS